MRINIIEGIKNLITVIIMLCIIVYGSFSSFFFFALILMICFNFGLLVKIKYKKPVLKLMYIPLIFRLTSWFLCASFYYLMVKRFEFVVQFLLALLPIFGAIFLEYSYVELLCIYYLEYIAARVYYFGFKLTLNNIFQYVSTLIILMYLLVFTEILNISLTEIILISFLIIAFQIILYLDPLNYNSENKHKKNKVDLLWATRFKLFMLFLLLIICFCIEFWCWQYYLNEYTTNLVVTSFAVFFMIIGELYSFLIYEGLYNEKRDVWFENFNAFYKI